SGRRAGSPGSSTPSPGRAKRTSTTRSGTLTADEAAQLLQQAAQPAHAHAAVVAFGGLGVELLHHGVVLAENVLAQDAGLLVAVAAEQGEGHLVLRAHEGEGLVEPAVVPDFIEDPHAVQAQPGLAVRGEDPAPVAEDRAV